MGAQLISQTVAGLPVINLPTRSKTGIRASSKRPIAVLAAAGAKGSHVEEKGLGLTSS